jgi:hypothetical protein
MKNHDVSQVLGLLWLILAIISTGGIWSIVASVMSVLYMTMSLFEHYIYDKQSKLDYEEQNRDNRTDRRL